MEKENHTQLELFSHDPDSLRMRNRLEENSFLRRLRRWEKTIFIIIGIIVTGIISFSLGVEKGKKIALLRSDYRAAVPAQSTPVPQVKTKLQEPKETPAVLPSPKPQIKEYIQGYAIQLASYKTRSYAQREAEALKKRGLTPSILSKGSYVVLYVGNFSDKQTAQSALSKLRKRYSDCRIVRRL